MRRGIGGHFVNFGLINFAAVRVGSSFCFALELTIDYFEFIFSRNDGKVFITSEFFRILCKVCFVFIFGFLHSLGLVSLVDYGGKGRDQNTREDRNNGDDNDELYDRKALFVEFFLSKNSMFAGAFPPENIIDHARRRLSTGEQCESMYTDAFPSVNTHFVSCCFVHVRKGL